VQFWETLMLAACSQQVLQPAQATAEAVINQVAPTAKAAIEQAAPTIRALVPTPPPAATPDPEYPSTLETAIILPAGTHYKDTGPDDGTWRFIEVQGGGRVWVLRTRLTEG
jgi:hypothetical protein